MASKKKKKKSTAKFFKPLAQDTELFREVVFIVEATHHEQHCFWRDYFHKPIYDNCRISQWDQESAGQMIQIGELDGRPVNISINWNWLEGYRVMFYEAVSQVVDYEMVDKWIKHFSLDTIRWDNGYRWAHTDSMNFHHCIHAIQELVKKHGIKKVRRAPELGSFQYTSV